MIGTDGQLSPVVLSLDLGFASESHQKSVCPNNP